MAKQKITDEQFLQERAAGLTLREIAEKYDMHIRSVEDRSVKIAKKGVGHGNGDKAKAYVPDGYMIKGTSTYVSKSGDVSQWIKTEVDKERQEALLQAAVEAFASDIEKSQPNLCSPLTDSETLCLYPIFDMHIGALAHKHESGENYSTDIAERVMNQFFDYSVDVAPSAERAVLLIGGDMLHSDGLEAVTPASGHSLDQDSRYAKLVHVAIRATRRAIDKMLQKHQTVEIHIIEGNHDQSGMIWLRAAMAMHYEKETRVIVDVSPRIIHHTQWGKTFLAYHHGHTIRKPEALLMACAADWRQDFGKSDYVYAHVGHWHHQTVTEAAIGIVEVHGTMAAKDAYAARGGWRSQRRAAVVIYSKDFGEVGRFTFRPEMFK
jgi:hypothetical protein